MNKCTICKKIKSEDSFNFKLKKIGLRHKQCKECTRLSVRNHYNKNQSYYLQKTKKRNKYLRMEVLEYINNFLSKNHCVDCHESDMVVLEFDHNGKVPKFKAVSSLIRFRYSLQKVKEEIVKCEVRCANCHRRKTARDFKWYKSKKPL